MTPSQSTVAVILRTRPYGESDKIVTFLSHDHGKLTGIAKGAKNSRRRFANCLDPFTGVRVHFRSRPNASLVFMESCDLIDPPGPLCDPLKFAYASYLTELIDQLTFEGQPTPELFELLSEGLLELRRGPATGAFLRGFELRLLKHAGYEPQLGFCQSCRTPITSEATAFVDAVEGRVLCGRCQTSGRAALSFNGSAVVALEALKTPSLADARERPLRGDVGARATELLGHLLAVHLPRPLRSTELIATISRERC